MEFKWLEDCLSLVESGSFSRSSEQRHVTQAAFSRRIRALKAWLGVALVDRSTYPTRLADARLGLDRLWQHLASPPAQSVPKSKS